MLVTILHNLTISHSRDFKGKSLIEWGIPKSMQAFKVRFLVIPAILNVGQFNQTGKKTLVMPAALICC